MTLFYDPKKKKVKPWVIAVFVIVPIIILVLIWVASKDMVAKKQEEKALKDSVDIFEKF